MSPSFRLRFGYAQFEMLVRAQVGCPAGFWKEAWSHSTLGDHKGAANTWWSEVSICFSFLSSSVAFPSGSHPHRHLPACPNSCIRPLLGSPSRLIASTESTFKAPLCLCTCCSFGSQRACLSPSRVPHSIPFPSVPLKTLFPPGGTALFLDSLKQLACAGEGSGGPYLCLPHLSWNLTFRGVLGKCGVNGYINECSIDIKRIYPEGHTPPRKQDQDEYSSWFNHRNIDNSTAPFPPPSIPS